MVRKRSARCQITLDAGTSNTRACLWNENRELLAAREAAVGVACTAIDGDAERLRNAVKACIAGLLEQSGVREDEVECILASGMITSNVGLREIPHLTAPVGLAELANGIREEKLPDISAIPFWFIPGVKNYVEDLSLDNFSDMDMMRGEETEAIALLAELPPETAGLLILPGSHTKFIRVKSGKLTACLTTLTGELLSVLTRQTVLADTLGKRFARPETYNRKMAELGYRTAAEEGLARAAFAARILHQQAGRSPEEIASYVLGAVLEQDLRALRKAHMLHLTEETRIVLSGKEIFCRALWDLLRLDGSFRRLSWVRPRDGISLASEGALKLYDFRKQQTE